ncbi:GntR family transcriptional regulator [Sphaerisporangium sp. TRM90804]|uniref:GntR family transcriptional regulator n=1 Tax=Sphaerisporangium sp. TRM90804 TaxID=3031113 RepID=UPI00244916E5|nr:GntR family transcriptional regulator [Sphaerisporangium sp. TRM90804]MDH2424022.1 GntR family transcriptional regulator [Sphaerisporangium sp. TRM90804]
MYDTTEEPALQPVARATTRTDLVAGSIRTAILSGRIKPGETLVERRLAEQLGVSKTPVREALIGLAASGLVTISPNRGVTVRVLDTVDLRKATEVRLLLEPWAVAGAARHARPGGLPSARRALAEAGELLSGQDPAALSLANRRFHRALYSGCGNELVTAHLDNLQDLTALGAVTVLWRRWPTWREEFEEHERILLAAEAGDAAQAERLTRAHVKRSLTHLAPAPAS